MLHDPSIFDYLGHFESEVSIYLAAVSLSEMKPVIYKMKSNTSGDVVIVKND